MTDFLDFSALSAGVSNQIPQSVVASSKIDIIRRSSFRKQRMSVSENATAAKQKRQEKAELWVSQNATTGMLPSELIAAEGGDLSMSMIDDVDFSTDILSVSSESDTKLEDITPGNTAGTMPTPRLPPPPRGRVIETHTNPENTPSQTRPPFHQPNCDQKTCYESPRRFVINSNELGTRRYQIRLPGCSEDLDLRVNTLPKFSNDAHEATMQRIDSLLQRQHLHLERHLTNLIDNQLNRF